ncbi:hypothetical protein [Pedobacter sp. N23S346]|uniref:hypothetical protein n=1 Tax=Pedobacter sp. N23S346 TaxID=3402750 RepID=UPI003AD61A33
MNIDHSFKNYENIPTLNISQRDDAHESYLNYLDKNEFMNYRLLATIGCGAEMSLAGNNYILNKEIISVLFVMIIYVLPTSKSKRSND